MKIAELLNRPPGAEKELAGVYDRKVYAKKGPVYAEDGSLICILSRDVLELETPKAADFEWPVAKDGDPMPKAIFDFVNDYAPWRQEA